MAGQPIWKITVPDEIPLQSVEELLAKAATWRTEGTGLQIERLDVIYGSTYLFVSGSEADAQALLVRIGERSPKLAGRVTHAACSVEELHRPTPETSHGGDQRRPGT